MTDDLTQDFDTADAADVERLTDAEEYRSLLKISPTNEAAACETLADCQAKIEAELDRETPRRWVIALFNDRQQELRENAE